MAKKEPQQAPPVAATSVLDAYHQRALDLAKTLRERAAAHADAKTKEVAAKTALEHAQGELAVAWGKVEEARKALMQHLGV